MGSGRCSAVVRTALVLAVAALALAACGNGDCSCAPGPVTPSAVTRAPGFDVLVTDQDRALSVRVGQKVEVYLVQAAGMTKWSEPASDDVTVLQPINTGIVSPPQGASVGGFLAARDGVTNVTASASPRCAANQACPAYARLLSVTVTVT